MTERLRRVLVLGATGHIGQAIVRHALACGREVTAVSRRENPEPLRGLAVKIVRVDPDLRNLPDLVSGHDLLIDAAGPYRLVPDLPGSPSWQAQVESAVRRTEKIVDAGRRHGTPLVHVSSCTTVRRPMSSSQQAAAVWRRSISPYFEAKAAMERAVVAAARNGLRAVIVNPGAFLGPWEYRTVEASFVRSVLEQRFPMVLDQAMCVIDVRDVAEAIDRALVHEFYGRPVPLSGHNISLQNLVMLTAQLAGLQLGRPLLLPPDTVLATIFWMQRGFMAWGLTPPEPLGFLPLIADVLPMPRSPEQTELGVTIRPLETTLREAIAFHRQRRAA
ncbi:MAG TPA: NAD-dependent epimerase/dehydratase family protein [Terracidiphilus sp.]